MRSLRRVVVNDLMQRGYEYELAAPAGRGEVTHVKDLPSLRATLRTLADRATPPARGHARRP